MGDHELFSIQIASILEGRWLIYHADETCHWFLNNPEGDEQFFLTCIMDGNKVYQGWCSWVRFSGLFFISLHPPEWGFPNYIFLWDLLAITAWRPPWSKGSLPGSYCIRYECLHNRQSFPQPFFPQIEGSQQEKSDLNEGFQIFVKTLNGDMIFFGFLEPIVLWM